MRTIRLILTALAALTGTASWANPTSEDAPYVMQEAAALETLVAPIALYPDDLLAIVLPASTFPLQIVQAARFVSRPEEGQQPAAEWDDSVVALTNYPEALEQLNQDLDWTWQLGEAVLYQEEDVLAAVSRFRAQAKEAGNLESNDHQVVTTEGDHISIDSASDTEIYVPYYDTEAVVHRAPARTVVRYYPTPYPVYYYPYRYGYRFSSDYFWGVSAWYGIGWSTLGLHRLHHSYRHHPYYRRSYGHHYYRTRPYRGHRNGYDSRRFHADNSWRHNRYRRHGARPGDRHLRHRYDRPRRDYRYDSPRDRRAARADRRNRPDAARFGNQPRRPSDRHNRIGRSQDERNARIALGRVESGGNRRDGRRASTLNPRQPRLTNRNPSANNRPNRTPRVTTRTTRTPAADRSGGGSRVSNRTTRPPSANRPNRAPRVTNRTTRPPSIANAPRRQAPRANPPSRQATPRRSEPPRQRVRMAPAPRVERGSNRRETPRRQQGRAVR